MNSTSIIAVLVASLLMLVGSFLHDFNLPILAVIFIVLGMKVIEAAVKSGDL